MRVSQGVDRLIELIVEEFNDLDPVSVRPESTYREVIEWNSINSVVLSVVIEAEFGVLLAKEDYLASETLIELWGYIERKVGRKR